VARGTPHGKSNSRFGVGPENFFLPSFLSCCGSGGLPPIAELSVTWSVGGRQGNIQFQVPSTLLRVLAAFDRMARRQFAGNIRANSRHPRIHARARNAMPE
jgi:hypothetical protein